MWKIGVLGAGTMGSGIAQVAAQNGHYVVLVEINEAQLKSAHQKLNQTLDKLVDKGKMTVEDKADLIGRIQFSNTTNDFSDCQLVIEAIVEDINVKKQVFKNLESIVSNTTILASNTSSLSIASIGAALNNPSRIVGIHFFNPAPLMPLVEIIPAVQTSKQTVEWAKILLEQSPLSLRLLKASFNAADEGIAGVQQLAGDATLLYYMSEEAQEGRNAYKEKRKPDFKKFPRRP